MILDKSIAKKLLRIDSDNTEYDDYLDAIIPPLQLWLESYLKNDFISGRVYVNSYDIEFNAEDSKIICSDTVFGNYQFKANIDIEVHGSFNNDGIYTVSSVAPKELTLSSGDTLIDEDTADQQYQYWVTIAKKIYPEGLQMAFAKLIRFNLSSFSFNPEDRQVKSESFAGYSVSNGQPYIVDTGKYPQNILVDLKCFKNKKVKLL